MGSSAVPVHDEHLHVGYDRRWRTWWAVGKEGSYGGSPSRTYAIATAVDASASRDQGRRTVIVYDVGGAVAFRITDIRVQSSSQLFQDDVP